MLLDGAPVALACSWLTHHRWERLTGADLFVPILEMASANGYSVGFLGGSPAMHAQLASALESAIPRLKVAGYWAPSRVELSDPDRNRQLAAQISRAGTDVLFVGLGKPRQEQWMSSYGKASGARVLLGFGAAADFFAGYAERAPIWVREIGMEWLYRLSREPKRLGKRYLLQGPVSVARMLGRSNRVRTLKGSADTAPTELFVISVMRPEKPDVKPMLESIRDACRGIRFSGVI